MAAAIHSYEEVEASINKHAKKKLKAFNNFTNMRKDVNEGIRQSTILFLWVTAIAVVPAVILALSSSEHHVPWPKWMVLMIVVALIILHVVIFVLAKTRIETPHIMCTYYVAEFRDIDQIMDAIAAAENLPPLLRARAGEVRDRYTVTQDDLARLSTWDLLKLTAVCAVCVVATVGSLVVLFHRAPPA